MLVLGKVGAQEAGAREGGVTHYRKKPVVVEAEQFWPQKTPWPDGVESRLVHERDRDPCYSRPFIKTLEGEMYVTPGDWVITGVKGERYPCKPDIFEATYEAVEAPA